MRHGKPATISENPSLDEAEDILNKAFSERRTVLIVGNCWVEYQGRASSMLKPGERIAIVKEDGSVLIHRSRGYEPVNWQPPGCILQAQRGEGCLTIVSVRRSPRETVKIFFDKILFLSVLELKDEGEFSLYASEEDMRRAILMEPSIIEDGFKPVEYEKKIEPGFIDVYGVDREGRMVVVEIKRRTAGKEAVLQLAKYVEALRADLGQEVRGILAAPDISREAGKLLISLGLSFKRVDPRRCSQILSRIGGGAGEKKIMDFL
ncbi:MAG: endonuclease NucS [Candidatus Bathyarchaeota archaeon]|nr:endonuclease NucS [Candidatus Bathyarchaeota archaeon]